MTRESRDDVTHHHVRVADRLDFVDVEASDDGVEQSVEVIK